MCLGLGGNALARSMASVAAGHWGWIYVLCISVVCSSLSWKALVNVMSLLNNFVSFVNVGICSVSKPSTPELSECPFVSRDSGKMSRTCRMALLRYRSRNADVPVLLLCMRLLNLVNCHHGNDLV